MLQKLIFTALGGLAGFVAATALESKADDKAAAFQRTFDADMKDFPYLVLDKEFVEALAQLAAYKEHAPELLPHLLRYSNRMCAFYQNALDSVNSTSRMGDILSVGALRTSLTQTLRNYVKMVFYMTKRDLDTKRDLTQRAEKVQAIVDGINSEMSVLVSKRVQERALRQRQASRSPSKKKAHTTTTSSKPKPKEATPPPPALTEAAATYSPVQTQDSALGDAFNTAGVSNATPPPTAEE